MIESLLDSILTFVAIAVITLLVIPILIYLYIKIGTIGFYHGKKDFETKKGNENEQEEKRENVNGQTES